MLIVTPGVMLRAELASGAATEHARPADPLTALRTGATHVVLGRSLTRASDPDSVLADLVRTTRSNGTDQEHGAQAWPQPIREGDWTDGAGITWRIRGRGIEPRGPTLRRLLKRPDLRVLHAYGPHPLEVSGRERDALLERVERYVAGEGAPHSVFVLAEFRNNDRQAMLVIEEAC